MPALAERPVAKSDRFPRRPELRRRWQRIPQGSPAEDELVKKYLPLVKTVVGRLAMTLPSHVDLDDLNSAGLVGLLNAVRNFNPHCGSSFETYARLRIRGAVVDELRRLDWIPRSVHAKARKVQETMRTLEQIKGRSLSEAEMARAMKLSLAEYQHLLDEIRPATFVCLDSTANTDQEDGPSPYESIADTTQENPVDTAMRREMTRLITKRLEEMPEMQRKVLALYYFEGLRLREIAEAFGLTQSRICQIHTQAILCIKSYLQRFDPANLAVCA
jgi:RNA polymerase sigma factor for flagellar operon FliA